MELTRREFLGLGKGAAAASVLAGLGLAGTPKQARAIIGIDDALLGAVVVAIASLGGYALYNQYVGNNSLQAVGASFGNYVSVSGNREAAIQAAMAAAALHGIAGTQPDFERAGNIIANGEGAFLSAMESAASTGRLALDGLVSGSDALVGMMRELVSGWLASGAMGDIPQTVPSVTSIGTDGTGTLTFPVGLTSLQAMCSSIGASVPSGYVSGYLRLNKNWRDYVNGTSVGELIAGTTSVVKDAYMVSASDYHITAISSKMRTTVKVRTSPTLHLEASSWSSYGTTNFTYGDITTRPLIMTPDLVGAIQLPAVDRAADAPDVVGASWDSVPIATDMVIDPTTGDITSAGSITLPSSIPTTAGDYAATLQGALAGVVTDAIALPLSLSVPVTVATPVGVATMPISEAIASETSLQLDYAPDIPIDPVLPPVEVPEGPWTSAVELPFMNVWPFNMIYTFIETMSRLGGN